MKNLFVILILSALLSSCAAFKDAKIGDDLYAIHDRTEIAAQQKAAADRARDEAEAREAAWAAKIAEARALAAEGEIKEISNLAEANINPYDAVLADDYQSAYARRLYGFSSPSYRMPSSYYTFRYTDAYQYASAYDPSFYNIMVSGDQVWVEPKYITSMFGSWGAAVVVPTYSWYYGWIRPSYSWWYGYPRYSWYDWGWGVGYDPYWGWNWGFGWGGYPYYPGYIPPHHHHNYYPPHYGGGGSHHRPNVVHRPANSSRPGGAPSYISGAGSSASNGRGGYRGTSGTVTGSGQYRGSSSSREGTTNSQYRGNSNSNSNTRNQNTFNQRNDNNSFRGSSSNFGGYSGGYGGGGHHSGSSHGNGQGRR